MDNVIYTISVRPAMSTLIDRKDIACIAMALLLGTTSVEFERGIVALATALGLAVVVEEVQSLTP